MLATNKTRRGIEVVLPEGKWRVMCYDVIEMRQRRISEGAKRSLSLDAPAQRAVLFHLKKVRNILAM